MAITVNKYGLVEDGASSLALSQIFAVPAASTNPAYLVLTALDRDEYTAGASGATGYFTGNGHTLSLSSIGSDGRGAGIVFTYQAASGRYFNSTYGYLDQLTYTASGSTNDVTNLSLFGTSNLSLANADAGNPYAMMQDDASGYIGSATVTTQPKFTGSVPTQATPDSIATVAESFVGQAWNMDGCWVLASTIAADAGSSLPVQSTELGIPGVANGEWIVAFNGPTGQSGNWVNLVHTGEIIAFEPASGGGHITTCVSGSGSTAMLVDNITYENPNGSIQNAANDGSANDIIISAAHAASQEFSGVQADTVVIYELDTPVVTASLASDTLAAGKSLALSGLFTAADPAGHSITEWQIYDTATSDTLANGGTSYQDHSASTALTETSLAAVSLVAGSTATTDTLELRAYNGTYWGDWTALSVSVTATAPASPPVVASKTANQTWLAGQAVSLTLPAGTFNDPQGEALTYSAALSTGAALPSWLSFNAKTDSFTGTAPTTAQSLAIVVKATDTSSLSVTESFTATVIGAPTVTAATAKQSWTEGQTISLTLAANTFTDPQGQALHYAATLTGGGALPSWLHFNTATDAFTGTAPSSTASLSIVVTATDTSGLSVSETFAASVVAPTPQPGITVTNQTANQSWTDGTAHALVLPSNTFTDALGLKMTFAAYQVSGTSVASWLSFNANTLTLSATPPSTASGTVGLEIIATDADHVSATDMFSLTFVPAAKALVVGSTTSTGGVAALATSPDQALLSLPVSLNG